MSENFRMIIMVTCLVVILIAGLLFWYFNKKESTEIENLSSLKVADNNGSSIKGAFSEKGSTDKENSSSSTEFNKNGSSTKEPYIEENSSKINPSSLLAGDKKSCSNISLVNEGDSTEEKNFSSLTKPENMISEEKFSVEESPTKEQDFPSSQVSSNFTAAAKEALNLSEENVKMLVASLNAAKTCLKEVINLLKCEKDQRKLRPILEICDTNLIAINEFLKVDTADEIAKQSNAWGIQFLLSIINETSNTVDVSKKKRKTTKGFYRGNFKGE